ncbi:MAG TPA: mannosyltransferase family protein [Nostocaceae cyanobacterium]|nr:mannosyltransferase family protein [Nostocaceae cyanobacterium]
MQLTKIFTDKNLLFPSAMWFFSRLVIGIAMLLIAPLLPHRSSDLGAIFGWDVFYAFDSFHYEQIVTEGYKYSPSTKEFTVAFFPLFPLLISGLTHLGIPFKIAGTLINNLAFLAALIILFNWLNQHYNNSIARWATATLAWFPMSLFGTVIYTEGLYLLFSIATLKAFENKQYTQTAIWGTLATATRPTGIALIPALALASFKERREVKAYIASLATGMGIFIYSLYCQIQFNDALIFIRAQKAWRPSLGLELYSWLDSLLEVVVGPVNLKFGYLKDPVYLVAFLSIVTLFYLLWYFRQQLGAVKVGYIFFALTLFLWLIAGDPLINLSTVLFGTFLLWYLRTELNSITMIYGCCGLGLIFAAGGTLSLGRIAYGIVSLSIALGVLLSRYPRLGYALLTFFGILLTSFSVRFAQNLWVA